MLGAIDEAREQVLLEMYWFGSDRVGRRFADALVRARRRGVQVAVLYDSLGSIGADRAMFDALVAAGAALLEYHPVLPWHRRFRLDRLTIRDHRKILVVDGRVGFTGGINLADPWLPEDEGGQGWRDDMVCVEGPAVRGFLACFDAVWRRQQGRGIVDVVPADRLGTQAVRVLGGGPLRYRRDIVRAYLRNIWHARERIWISNSYFVPDRAVRRALIAAARRGVDVRILQPGRSDRRLARWASRAMWSRLLRRGVRIFEWQNNVLHAKTAVIDGTWSTIGTFNLDYLSLRSNLEVNVAVRDGEFAAAMEASFERDLAESVEVRFEEFRRRGPGRRLLEAVGYRLRKLL